MRQNSEPRTGRALHLALLGVAVLAAACDSTGPDAPATGSNAGSVPARATAEAIGRASPTGRSMPGTAASAPPSGVRTRELVNPEASTMVLLYYDLANIAVPVGQWVEKDNRVQFARPIDKPALRGIAQSEIESAKASVSHIGAIRLSMAANLSDYDPTYGEFTVRALSPSSVVEYPAFGEKVMLRFANGRTAQIWRVPPAQAQTIRDRVGFYPNVELDVLLKVRDAVAAPAGGTISVDVLEYELRDSRDGSLLGRVEIGKS
jgi:hypothetical protein